MTKFTNEQCNKAANGTLSHEEWNQAASNINDLIDASSNAEGGSVSSSIAANFELTGGDGNNMTIKSAKHLNLEPSYKVYDAQNQTWSSDNEGDLQLKPGDDIALYSHHRSADKRDEVSLKVLDGADKPVKLQIQAGEITLQAKQKNLTKKKDTTTGEDNAGTADTDYLYKDDQANVFDINVTTEYKPNRGSGSKKTGKGYLKVRAQAIDLRCEANGGIALQPKGEDSDHHMNKIKFEHGGGDGLEFGTFNTEHTSLFTEDYRFNKNGVVKLATRQTEVSDKADPNDPTTAYKYVKQSDDLYDVINNSDPTCTWEQIVNTSNALGNNLRGIYGYYIFPLTEAEPEPNMPQSGDTLYEGSYSALTGIDYMVGAYAYTVDTNIEFVTNGVSAQKIANLYTVPSNSANISETKYLPSIEVDDFFNLGTGSYNSHVYDFLQGMALNTVSAFRVGSTVYGIVKRSDTVDLKINIPNSSNYVYLNDIFRLVEYFKNGAGKNSGPWAPTT